VKEVEISLSFEDAWRVPRPPRYRYYSNPPATVFLRLADLAPEIPEAARLPGFNPAQSVELSCEEIFTGPVPKLSLSRLAELAGESIRSDDAAESSIKLPIARLALAYRFVNRRELIEEPRPTEVAKPERSPEDFAPKGESTKAAEGLQGSTSPEETAAPAGAKQTGIAQEGIAPDARSATRPGDVKASPSEAETPGAGSAATASILGATGPGAEMNEAKPSEPWRPITVFPIFRRKVVEPPVKPPVAPVRPVVESRAPLAPNVPSESLAHPEAETRKEPSEAPAKESAPSISEAVLVEPQRPPGPLRKAEIVDQDALQAVFMTEEMLSVDRVVELCGGLPGIKSCILAHGAAVLASHNVPESIDLVSLSAHALEMLAAMRQSAARMGVGAVPAVTIHAEKGPISFFHQDDLCLLVMHKDRGFVPGVREKLQKVVEYLAQGHPALEADGARLAWASQKRST
jgi:predicted regulator of Ras-like GTPase activity (Roadblock/LC7/MglB family)